MSHGKGDRAEASGGNGASRHQAEARRIEAALRSHPDDGRAWQTLALLRHRLGEHEAAVAAFEEASVRVPLNPRDLWAWADALVRVGRPAEACGTFQVLADDPACPVELLPAVASGLGALGAFHDALAACRTLIRRDPGRHEAVFGVAFYLRKLGRPVGEALPMLVRAHEMAPDSPLYRAVLASALLQVGRRDDARDLLASIPPGTIRCRCCLRRIMDVFGSADRRDEGKDGNGTPS